jgi:uncharacterized protein (DUF1330 family)
VVREWQVLGHSALQAGDGSPAVFSTHGRQPANSKNKHGGCKIMSGTQDGRYLDATREAVESFASRSLTGELVMLNLLRFRDTADYSKSPELAPETPISGREAYALYIAHALPHLKATGGDVLFLGEGGNFLIGPAGERWDRVALIHHRTIADFLKFATNKDYLAGAGHRIAALADSRLLPLENLRQHW